MTIEAGQQLLHYRLSEQIGEGGMGVVWKAVDTTLDREVAIKLLPQAFADQADRLARFEREAKLLASLNHPNIAAVYGLHQADTPAGTLRFIAMELVAGEDLAERLARGPLPVAETLAIAAQIAEGLSAAHEAGVIHRDLKPANVKLTAEGKVKVLDFGLAKAFDSTASSSDVDLSHSPTVTSAGTMVGVILGTAAYMSPEQARGRPTDRRTDIWAFGSVLFEMLTGRKPFPGEVLSDIIAKILEREPAWGALPAPLHPGVRRLLERCLRKDPEERLRDAADVRLEIRDLMADPTGERSEPSGPAAPAATSAKWTRVLPWVLLAALLAWVVVVPRLSPSPGPSPGRVVHFQINPPTGYQFGEFTTSPDGTAMAFVASSRDATRSLWVRRLDSTTEYRLPGTEGAMFPFWSPDTRSVGFFSGGKLRRIDLASSSLQTIADAPNGRGASWGQDGTILFTPEGADVLYTVPASGGTPRAQTALQDTEGSHRFPHFVGNTRKFTFSAHDRDSSVTLRRYLGSLDSDALVSLVDGMSETYAPPGFALLIREATLCAQEFDAETGSLSGDPFPLANDIDDTFPRTGRSAFSVSDNGVLMYLARRKVDSRIDAYDRNGRKLETVVPGGDYEVPVLSKDGRQVVFARASSGETSLWIMDLARASSSRLTMTKLTGPSWSADDRSILYGNEGQIFRLPVSGGEPALLLDAQEQELRGSLIALADPDESTDGSFVAFSAWDPVTDFDLWLMPLDGKREPRRLTNASGVQGTPKISPNMRWIAYVSDESGRFEVYVRSPAASDQKWLVSTAGGAAPSWSADGSELYYVSADYGIMAVSIDPSATRFQAGIPQRLFDGPLSVEDNSDRFFRQPWLVGVDGERFLFRVPDEEVRARTIEVVLNWEELLER